MGRLNSAWLALACAAVVGGQALAQSETMTPLPPPGAAAPGDESLPPPPDEAPSSATTTGTTVYSPVPAPLITSPDLIARCLCGQQHVASLQREAEAAQRRYQDAKQRLDALNQRMETTRGSVDTNDNSQVDAFRRLVAADEQASAHLYSDVMPATQATVERYNAVVKRYNAECAGQHFSSAAISQVSATLSCAPEPEAPTQPVP